jgi:threonylcarbamoyladenosine tRNA methylthiotransferase MtaB
MMSSVEIPLQDLLPGRERRVPATSAGRVAVSTLGCKINSFESEQIVQALRDRKWQAVGGREQANLHIINTCTVTGEADRQARQEVRRAVRRNPDALIVVTGCYAQMDPEACAAIPGVDLVLGNDRKLDLHDLLPLLQSGRLPKVMVGEVDRHVSLPRQIVGAIDGRTRAFVQVQQGCDQGCTFCVIHRARGPSRSLPAKLVIRQAQRLVMNGCRELVVCGVDLGSYGEDGPHQSSTLVKILNNISELDGDFRIRLSSIDPAHLTDELFDLLAAGRKMCPHLHLSLQSGNTLILKRMRRRYDADHVLQRIRTLRERLPGLVLSADVMVGFPTETEEHYQQTENMVRDLEIAYPHVFVYSPRTGTPAARIPAGRQVPVAQRRARADRLRRAAALVRRDVLQRRLGDRIRVLVEGGGSPPAGLRRARAGDYVPVWVPTEQAGVGDWLDVEVFAVSDDALIARAAT